MNFETVLGKKRRHSLATMSIFNDVQF